MKAYQSDTIHVVIPALKARMRDSSVPEYERARNEIIREFLTPTERRITFPKQIVCDGQIKWIWNETVYGVKISLLSDKKIYYSNYKEANARSQLERRILTCHAAFPELSTIEIAGLAANQTI